MANKPAKLLGLADAKFTKADSRAIADWYESYGYGPDMIAEAAAYAGEKHNILGGGLRRAPRVPGMPQEGKTQ
mgnify:CR=1 FL=1